MPCFSIFFQTFLFSPETHVFWLYQRTLVGKALQKELSWNGRSLAVRSQELEMLESYMTCVGIRILSFWFCLLQKTKAVVLLHKFLCSTFKLVTSQNFPRKVVGRSFSCLPYLHHRSFSKTKPKTSLGIQSPKLENGFMEPKYYAFR